jgi:hypothetical protein
VKEKLNFPCKNVFFSEKNEFLEEKMRKFDGKINIP